MLKSSRRQSQAIILIAVAVLFAFSEALPSEQVQANNEEIKSTNTNTKIARKLSSPYVERIECNAPETTFNSFIALAVDGAGVGWHSANLLGETLVDKHRQGTALQCDPYQRSLTEAQLINIAVTTPIATATSGHSDYDKTTVALYHVSVSAYNDDDDAVSTALEAPHPDFLATLKHPSGKTCALSTIVSNEADDDNEHVRCPRYGCYCPAADLDSETETTGLTEHKLQDLFDTSFYSTRRRLGKSGKKSNGAKHLNVVNVKELEQFECKTKLPLAADFLYSLSDNPCTSLTKKERNEFVKRLIDGYNLFQFNHCDPKFRRLDDFRLPVCAPAEEGGNINNIGRRSRRRLTPILYTSFGFASEESSATEFANFRRLQQQQGKHDNDRNDEPLTTTTTGTELDIHRLLAASSENDIDYGALNYEHDQCFCSAFFEGTPRGITIQEFQNLSDEILRDITGGRVSVESVKEVDRQACGKPRVFTQTVNVIANGNSGAVENIGHLLLEPLLNDLSLEKCVDSHFQILNVKLIYKQKKPAVDRQAFAWALQFQIQYVAFGVQGANAALFSTESYHRTLEEKYAFSFPSSSSSSSSPLMLGEVDRNSVESSLAVLPIENERKLKSILLATSCACDLDVTQTFDILPLGLVNREIDEAICDNELPGVTFAIIVL